MPAAYAPRLARLIDEGHLPHTLLFEGAGADSCAERTAAAIVCTGAQRPCGSCSHCIKAAGGNHPDILVYEPTGAQKIHKIDAVRELRSSAAVLPNEAAAKVYILRGVDSMPAASQDALLKITEEPPEFVYIILTCRQKNSLLPTILSRVAVFSDSAQVDEDNSESEAAAIAAEMARALTLPESLTLLRACNRLQLAKNRTLVSDTLDELSSLLRGVYRAKLIQDGGDELARELCATLTISRVFALLGVVEDIKSAAARNANPSLNMTRCCAALRAAAGK